MHKKLVLIGVFVLGFFNLFSQYEKAESAPPNIKWYEKKSGNFTVYFPEELDSIANYTINYLENNIDKIKFNPSDKIRRSKVILHNQNSISNAFVTSSPRRTEFYINAKPESPHFLHNNNWIDLLSAHEYRHLVQREVGYNSFFNKVVFYLFGEGLSSMLTRSSAPNWYWEGDAVNLETRIGDFGRGRIPHFTLTTQTNLLDKNKLKYDRQTLGSLKIKTPNEYETGYLMVKYLKDNFGDSVYNKIIKKAHNQSFLPLPFYRSLKKETNLNYKDLYKLSVKALPKKSSYLKKTPLNKRLKKNYISYLYPTKVTKDKLVVIRQGQGSYQDIGTIDKDGSFSLLFTPGLINDFGRIPSSENLIGWLEFDKDGRWDKRVFSSLKILNLNTKKIIKNTLKGFFASLDISPNAEEVVLLKNNLDGSQSLVFYEVGLSKTKKEIKLNGGVYSSIKYTSQNKLIGLKTKKGNKDVFVYNINKNSFETLYRTTKNIGWPTLKNDTLVFSTEHNGFEEIFLHKISTSKTYMIKSPRLGGYYPFLSDDGKVIYYSSMGDYGFDIYEDKISKNITSVNIKNTPNEIEVKTNQKTFKSKKTSQWSQLIQPISWGVSDYGFSEKGLDYLTLGLESRNLFNNLMFKGGYKLDLRDDKNRRFFGISYQGLYPILDLTLSTTNDFFNQNIILTKNNGVRDTIYDADINFKVREFMSTIKIPLSFTKGKVFTSFLGSISYYNERFKDFYTTSISSESARFPLQTTRDTREYFSGLIYYSRKHKKSKRQVYFPFEQIILLEGKGTTTRSDYNGKYFRGDLYLSFPGINNLHSLRFKFRGEKQSENDYLFRRNVNFVYGYTNGFDFSSFLGGGVEYEAPVFYPDISIGPLAYIQRVRMTGFFNVGQITSVGENNYVESPRSLGGEIKFDLNLFRQSFLFDLGFRFSYLLNNNYNQDQTTFNITLGSISF